MPRHVRFRRSPCVLVVALAVTVSPPAAAQTTLRSGDRIRVTRMNTGPPNQLIGRYGGVFRRSLLFFGDSVTPRLMIPDTTIFRIERSRGKTRLVTTGLPVVLGISGAMLAPDILPEDRTCRFRPDEPDCQQQTPDWAIGAAIGAVGGLLLGRVLAPERWEDVAPRWIFGTARGSGLEVGYRISF